MEDRLGLVYMLGIIWSFGLLLAYERWIKKRGLLLAGIVPLGAILTLRYSGTDTYSGYEVALWYSYLSGQPTGMEPGFDFLARWLTQITGSPTWAVRLLAVLFVAGLALFLWRSDYRERYFLLIYFIPVFFYQYGMNAVRAGLALTFLLLSWQSLRRGQWGPAVGLGLLAPLFQMTSLVVMGIFLLAETLRLGRKGLVILGIGALVILGLAFFNRERIEAKLISYFWNQNPSLHTVYTPQAPGLSRTAMLFVLLVGLTTLPLSGKPKALSWAILGGMTFSFQILSYYAGFAGIRLLELLTFALPLFVLRLAEFLEPIQIRGFFLALGLASVLGFSFNYKNFWADYGGRLTGSPTPFLPYRTVIDYQPCRPSYHYPWALPWRCPILDMEKDPLGPTEQPFPR